MRAVAVFPGVNVSDVPEGLLEDVVAFRTFRELEPLEELELERAGVVLELELLELLLPGLPLEALCLRLAATNAFLSRTDSPSQMLWEPKKRGIAEGLQDIRSDDFQRSPDSRSSDCSHWW